MAEIPLISKVWKPKQNPDIDPELAEILEQARQEGYNEATADSEEENMYIRDKPLPEDDKQFWAGTVFKPIEIQGSDMSKKVLPSLAMSNYPEKITLEREIYPYKNRLIYLKVGLVEKWIDTALELAKQTNSTELKKNYKDAIIILSKYMAVLLAKLEVDNRSRLSSDMIGLKEVNTRRGKIERQQNQKTLDQKLGVRE